jgi:hypothetical protein
MSLDLHGYRRGVSFVKVLYLLDIVKLSIHL